MYSLSRNMHLGRLMSPYEVAKATRSQNDIPERLRHEWTLCGEASPAFFDSFISRRSTHAFRLTAFRSPHATYAVFTVQAESSQCRFLMPLAGKVATSFLQAAMQSGFMLSLAAPDSANALLLPFDVEPVHVRPVYEMSGSSVQAKGTVAGKDLAMTAQEMMRSDRIPSAFHEVVIDSVDLVLVIPDTAEFDYRSTNVTS